MRVPFHRPIVLAVCLSASLYTQAQTAAVMVDIAPCMAITDLNAKQACYSELEARVRAGMAISAPSRAEVRVAPPAVVEPPAPPVREVTEAVREAPQQAVQEQAQPVEEFGRELPAQATIIQNQENGEAELHDTIVSMQQREPGRWLFTLASGQVWYQANTQRVSFKKGDEIRIYPSPIGGSWRMSRATGTEVGFIQVARVR
jgi:hypothetical protein